MSNGQVSQLWQLLSPNEQQRIHDFYFEPDQHRHLLSRGLLRMLLGQYLDDAPEDLRFKSSQYGKPALDAPYDETGLQFNVSHSHNLIHLAFCRNQPLGIDIQYMDPSTECDKIAERVFSSGEYEAFQNVPLAWQREAFFNGWTRKEAFIKALGDGLSFPLDAFEVTLHPAQPAQILQIQGDETSAHKWTLMAFEPENEYKAAAVVPGQGWEFCFWERPLVG